MGEFKGRTGLSPPVAYPSTVEREMQSPTPIYLGTSHVYIVTTLDPVIPDPTDRYVKNLGVPEGMMNHHLYIALNPNRHTI
jgi:hypothetical protein